LQRLLKHAEHLPVHAEIEPDVRTVLEEHSLLAEPDPVPTILGKVGDALRGALNDLREQYVAAVGLAHTDPVYLDVWERVVSALDDPVLRECALGNPPALSTGSEVDLLRELDTTSLPAWADRIAAVPQRFRAALEQVMRELQPTAQPVRLRRRTITTEQDLDAYLAELKAEVLAALGRGGSVILE
jgi:hypothetical protein